MTTNSPAPKLVPLPNMVQIKPGSFQRQKYTVTLTREFWLGKYEVTQAEYAAVMGTNQSYFKEEGDLRPVEKVSHTDAQAYCGLLTSKERQEGRLPTPYEYRLPTEAEWEYACRAGTTNFFSFDDQSKAASYAWTLENSEGKTHQVGQKLPNPWGLYDMHGNVWEWCADWFAKYPEADVRDPLGAPAGKHKVFRGGGWNNEIQFARSANRFVMAPTNGIHFVGFRVALGFPLPVNARKPSP
jgi:formylglycine-generating enzyme required for sulfatase activity